MEIDEQKHVLIVEDNKSIVKVLSRFLDLKGVEHTEANGLNGLNLIRQKKFYAILVDLNMPEFSGYDVINSLEKEGKLKDQNVFVFTATDISSSKEEELIKQGVKSCIRKPIRIDDLLTIIGVT